MAANGLRSRKSGWPRALLGLGLAGVLCAVMSLGFNELFVQLRDGGATPAEAGTALALVLTAVLIGLFVFDLHDAVATLLADPDLELLRRAPVAPWTVFAIKLVDALPRASTLVVVLALPAIATYAAVYPLPAWALPGLVLALVGLWAAPLGLAGGLSIAILTLAPARRAREALGLLTTATLVAMWLANSFLLPRLAGSEDPIGFLLQMSRAAPAAVRWSPGYQVAAYAAAAEGEGLRAATALLAILAVAAVAMAVAGWVASHVLDTMQARLAAGTVGRARPARGRTAAPARGFVAAVLRRDGRLLARDWTLLADVLTATVLWTLLPIVAAPVLAVDHRMLAVAMLLALTVALGFEVAARAVPFERQGIGWVRLAPVPLARWVAARLIGVALLSLALVGVAGASAATWLRLAPQDLGVIACIVLPALVVALATGFWTGARFGNPGWTNPRAMLSFGGRLTATALLLVQASAWLGYALSVARQGDTPAGWALALPAVAAAVIAAPVVRLAAAAVARGEA